MQQFYIQAAKRDTGAATHAGRRVDAARLMAPYRSATYPSLAKPAARFQNRSQQISTRAVLHCSQNKAARPAVFPDFLVSGHGDVDVTSFRALSHAG